MRISFTHDEYEDNKEFTVTFLKALGQNELAEQCQQMTVFDEMGVYETKMSSVNVDENGITIDYNPVASKAFFDYIIQRITFVSMIIGMIVTPLVALFSALKYVKNVPGMKSFVAGLVDYVDEAVKKDTAAKARTVVKEESSNNDGVDLVSALEKIRTVCPDGGNWYDVVRPYKTNGIHSPDKCRLLWNCEIGSDGSTYMAVDIYKNENGLNFDFFLSDIPMTHDIAPGITSYVAKNFSMAGLDVDAQAWIIDKMFDNNTFWEKMYSVIGDTTKTMQAWEMVHDQFTSVVSEYRTTQAVQQRSVDYNKKTKASDEVKDPVDYVADCEATQELFKTLRLMSHQQDCPYTVSKIYDQEEMTSFRVTSRINPMAVIDVSVGLVYLRIIGWLVENASYLKKVHEEIIDLQQKSLQGEDKLAKTLFEVFDSVEFWE